MVAHVLGHPGQPARTGRHPSSARGSTSCRRETPIGTSGGRRRPATGRAGTTGGRRRCGSPPGASSCRPPRTARRPPGGGDRRGSHRAAGPGRPCVSGRLGASDDAGLAKTMPPHSATCAGHEAQRARGRWPANWSLPGARAPARPSSGVAPLVIGAGHEPTDGPRAFEQGDAPVAADVVEGPERAIAAAHDGERDASDRGRHVGPGRRQLLGVAPPAPTIARRDGSRSAARTASSV